MFWSDLGSNVGYEGIGLVDSTLPTVGVFAKFSPKPKDAQEHTNTEAVSVQQTTTDEQKVVTNIPVSTTTTTTIKSFEQTNATEQPEDNYGKGVIFYLQNDIVVGILLWNVFNRINIARVIVNEGKKYDDLNEVAKLFDLHS